MTKHSLFSASGSATWLNCPAALTQQLDYENKGNEYAELGTIAHELADICYINKQEPSDYLNEPISELGYKEGDLEFYKTDFKVDQEMVTYITEYLDYVASFENETSINSSEERVNYSRFITDKISPKHKDKIGDQVPDSFGTLDRSVLDVKARTLHIFDLKYGKGDPVKAESNSQGMLYALGKYEQLSFLELFDKVVIHICQVRRHSYSNWEIDLESLLTFGKFVKQQSEIALGDELQFSAGTKQCKWCRAKGNCEALASFVGDVTFDYGEPPKNLSELADSRFVEIIENKKLIENFIEAVEKYALEKMDVKKEKISGLIVKTKNNARKYNQKAESVVEFELGDEAYNKKLKPVSEIKKLLGNDIVDHVCEPVSQKKYVALDN